MRAKRKGFNGSSVLAKVVKKTRGMGLCAGVGKIFTFVVLTLGGAALFVSHQPESW
jgi:hypothetical protein